MAKAGASDEPSPRGQAPLARLSPWGEDADLRTSLDFLSDGFALFDDNDRLVIHNARFLELFPFLSVLGDLEGLNFFALASVPCGEWSRVGDPDAYVAERMRRHHLADGEAFDIPLENGGWARVRERRTPAGGIVSTWTDISELKTVEQKLRDAINGIGEGFVLLDPNGSIILANASMNRLFATADVTLRNGGRFGTAIETAQQAGLFGPGTSPETLALLAGSADSDAEPRVEIELGNGSWLLAGHRRMEDGCLAAIWTDVTVQKRREQELIEARAQLEQQAAALADFARLVSRQARSDALTGLPNRFALEERLDLLLTEETQPELWLSFIDIDHFKTVNDLVGHAAGDRLLIDFAQFLRSQMRADDLIVRIGGDSFAVLLIDLDETEAQRIASRIATAARSHPFLIDGHSFALSVSIGLARAGGPGSSASALLVRADTACCVAKESGRDRVQIYDTGDPKVSDTHDRTGWAERIRSALELDRLILELQAIVDAEGETLGYEALIRLGDDEGEVHGPGHFLPAARRLGLMRRIDSWVCRRAVSYAARLQRRGVARYISVNIGARTLADPGFQKELVQLLDLHPGCEPALRVEITETEAVHSLNEITEFLALLRGRGIRTYLDDFGNGYNSFDSLKQLPVDGIKIDWRVTRDLLEDPIDEALMKAAISIAHSLDLELVAEGVETDAQLGKLRELGVTKYQGFYFHRPQVAEATLG
ncbi:putative bifunctional diguanylate cyclase/phosphodiesterase [Ancylobacter oerskovii]|uniref:Bifunctional diguanylate cyclase/phosphodiesterase n=1 Tax=Ancylobacter oerskovii TaxID=459519 RepID=A0ABW4YXJ8_9HYPH|nr:EAL domain-containing protein [Ancylobacter oerskovii]MBS7542128.1 EAL domain-containing protein [Ancylobacter oerskovii]